MRKALRGVCLVMTMIIPLLSLTSCFLFNMAATGVAMDRSTLSVAIGETKAIVATVSPQSALNRSVSWGMDNEAVATVSTTGCVTGVALGSATVTVTSIDGGFTDTCLVTVTNPVNVTGVTLPVSLAVTAGYTARLMPTIAPANATFQTVSWSTNDPSIATVDKGIVTGVSIGSTTITVTTTSGGFSANCTVNVVDSGEIIIIAQ